MMIAPVGCLLNRHDPNENDQYTQVRRIKPTNGDGEQTYVSRITMPIFPPR